MSLLVEMLVDDKHVHLRSPAEYAGVQDARCWIPGVYSWVSKEKTGEVLNLAVIGSREDGDLEGFVLISDDRDEVHIYLPQGIYPAACAAPVVTIGRRTRITGKPGTLTVLLEEAQRVSRMFPRR